MDWDVATWASTGGTRALMSEDLADRLITAIGVGAFSPGEKLPPERELAELLEVSRATLRQAIQQVTALGLVESRRGRGGGTFVTFMDWHEAAPSVARTLEAELPRLAELFDFRCLVEGVIARAAAGRRTDEDVADLQALLADFRVAPTMIEARALDRRLHGRVGAAARNPHLISLSAHLTARVTLGFGAEPYPQDYYDRALHEHEELVAHVVAGRVEQAGACAESHFRLTADILFDSLRDLVGSASPPPQGSDASAST